jgi:hypothetical protein
MSMMPASRVEFKQGLTAEEIKDTADKIRSIAGSFNELSNGKQIAVVVPTSNPAKLAQIRALPGVARVGHQF